MDGYSNCFEFIKTLELGCPESRLSDENTDNPDECRDEADQFLTTFTWTCPTRSGLISAPNLYMVELRTRVSSDDQGRASFVLAYPRLGSFRRLASAGIVPRTPVKDETP